MLTDTHRRLLGGEHSGVETEIGGKLFAEPDERLGAEFEDRE